MLVKNQPASKSEGASGALYASMSRYEVCYQGSSSGAVVVALRAPVGGGNVVVKLGFGVKQQGAIRAFIRGVPGAGCGGAVWVYVLHMVYKILV